MSCDQDRKNSIRNWFLLLLLVILVAAGSKYLLGQLKVEAKEETEEKKGVVEEYHTKSDQTKKEDDQMKQEKNYSEEECHKKFAVELNNSVWNLLGKKDRIKGEDEKMINAAHASLHHWSIVGNEINFQRGHWLISHVYAVLNRPEPALHHAGKCMELTEQHNFVDFDLAYAYEAMARAYAAGGVKSKSEKYMKLAQEAGEKIKGEEDKKLFFSDFDAGPWYGMR
jgi:hypothetical protein